MRMMMYAGVPIGFDEVMFCPRDPVTSPVDSVLPPLEVIDNPHDVDHLNADVDHFYPDVHDLNCAEHGDEDQAIVHKLPFIYSELSYFILYSAYKSFVFLQSLRVHV